MKNSAFRLNSMILAWAVFLDAPSNGWAAQVQQTSPRQDLLEKVLIALIAATLAFIGNLVLASLKRRSEPRKLISYRTDISGGLVTVADSIRQRISVHYQGREVKDLYHVRCVVENSGTSVVKDQYIRFVLQQAEDLVDAYTDPRPEPELGVEEVPLVPPKGNERKFRIAHLAKRQLVVFNFIATGALPPRLEVHPFNDLGDVDFVPRSVSIASDQSEELSIFIRLLVLFFTVPSVLRLVPTELGLYSAILAMLLLLIPIARRLGIVSTLVAKALQKSASDVPPNTQITIGTFEGEATFGSVNHQNPSP